jgi:hypothetical protein
MIVALDPPDFRTIGDFRKRHSQALAALFVQVLKLAEAAGLVKLSHAAPGGTKACPGPRSGVKANSSKHSAQVARRAAARRLDRFRRG